MRAIVFKEFGGPEVLDVADLPVPRPGPGQVTIDVAYAGVNFADLLSRGQGYRVETLPHHLGLEVSGRVRDIGPGVPDLAPGQEVAAFLDGGGYAEVALSQAATVFPLPDGLGLRTGATLPSVVPTAYALLHEVGRLREGDTVLVHGAAGGVGTAAGQLARMGGAAAVYGVVSTLDKAEHALKSGYDQVFRTETFDRDVREATRGRGVDIALDAVGGDIFRRTLDVVGRFGRLVSYGNSSGQDPWTVGPAQTFGLGRSVAGFSILELAADDPQRLHELAGRALRAATDGGIELPVTAEFALEDAADAHRLLASRTTTGKLLLRI